MLHRRDLLAIHTYLPDIILLAYYKKTYEIRRQTVRKDCARILGESTVTRLSLNGFSHTYSALSKPLNSAEVPTCLATFRLLSFFGVLVPVDNNHIFLLNPYFVRQAEQSYLDSVSLFQQECRIKLNDTWLSALDTNSDSYENIRKLISLPTTELAEYLKSIDKTDYILDSCRIFRPKQEKNRDRSKIVIYNPNGEVIFSSV